MDLAEYKKMDELEEAHPWFIAKRAFLSSVLKKYLPPSSKVLDVGCGTGKVMDFLSGLGYKVEGVDPSPEALGYCSKKQLSARPGTAEAIPFEDGSFDGAIALDVLEHLPEDGEGVKELWRVLRPDGVAIITVPAHACLFSVHDRRLHHFRRYSREQFLRLFIDDWEIKKISWIHSFILLPVAITRFLSKASPSEKQSSDVGAVSKPLVPILKLIYKAELFFFGILGSLPFGLSLLIVVQKKKYERSN